MGTHNEPRKPLVSIVTATRNAAHVLPQLIASVRHTHRPDTEWIVIDGASTDGTVTLLADCADVVTHFVSERDFGIYDALNKGVRLAKGEYLLFIGADDRLTDDGLSRLCAEVEQTHRAFDLYLASVQMEGRGQFRSRCNALLYFTNSIHHQGVAYRRTLFDGFSYRLDVPVYADYELNLRCFLDRRSHHSVAVDLAVCGARGVSHRTSAFQQYRALHEIRRAYMPRLLSLMCMAVGLANVVRRRFLG